MRGEGATPNRNRHAGGPHELAHPVGLEAGSVQVAIAVETHPSRFAASGGRIEHVDEGTVRVVAMDHAITDGNEKVSFDKGPVQRRMVEGVACERRDYHAGLV